MPRLARRIRLAAAVTKRRPSQRQGKGAKEKASPPQFGEIFRALSPARLRITLVRGQLVKTHLPPRSRAEFADRPRAAR